MESTAPVPHASPEMGVSNPQVMPSRPVEIGPQVPASVERSVERPAPAELSLGAPAQTATPALPAPILSQNAASATPPLLPLTTKDDGPAVAGDEEVIEKEWVDKAKKIIVETKNDPYKQEKEVSKLQADYLKKRYGKEIKLTND